MKAGFLLCAAVAAGLAGCATGYVPPSPSGKPGPAWEREIEEGRPGLFGDLRWNIDLNTGQRTSHETPVPATAAEQEEFKKWRESAGSAERQEFEDWRAWQEWKRKNPK